MNQFTKVRGKGRLCGFAAALLAAALPLADGEMGGIAAPRASGHPQPAVAERFIQAADFRGFVERYRGNLDDPETAYFVSQALEECALARPAAASTAAEDAEGWARLAAADALVAPCRGFDAVAIDPHEIFSLLTRAAAAGEPRAAARMLLFRDIAAPKADVLPALPALLATRDPSVVRDVGAFLSRGESAGRYGDEEFAVDAAAIAWELAACDLGYACGPTSRLALLHCAFDGRCESERYDDALARHEAAELMTEAQILRGGILRALRDYDWRWLGIVR